MATGSCQLWRFTGVGVGFSEEGGKGMPSLRWFVAC